MKNSKRGIKAKKRQNQKITQNKLSKTNLLIYILFFISLIGLFGFSYISNGTNMGFLADGQIFFEFSLFLFVLTFLAIRGRRLSQSLSELGLSKKSISSTAILVGLMIFILIFLLEIIVSLFSSATNISLPTNTQQVLSGFPFYFYVISAIIVPFCEETFFRGLLVPRIGIIPSAIIFGVLHYISYSSISELVLAIAFGLIAGYAFKRTKSLYSAIIPHFIIDLIGLVGIVH